MATRAGGHFATLYTHIDDLVESVRAITPGGVWESRRLPGSGAGPSPDRLLLGSEGILGVITEAWVRVRERPRWKLSAGVAFDSFAAGAEAVRELSQSGLNPVQLPAAGRGGVRAHPCRAAREGAARARVRVGAPPGRRPDGDRASRRFATTAASRGRSPAAPRRSPGGARFARTRRRRGRPGPIPSARGATPSSPPPTCETRFVALRSPLGHVRDRDHLGAIPRVPRPGDGERPAGDRRRLRRSARRPRLAPPFMPLHARLSRRPGALLHRALPGAARWRGGAVGRDQGRGLGGRDRLPGARSPTTMPSAATTARGTTASAPSRSPRRSGRRSEPSTPRECSTPGS